MKFKSFKNISLIMGQLESIVLNKEILEYILMPLL